MNLLQLKVFVSVMEYRSFSKAAAQMHLSQPTISAHIHGLEQELGIRLFRRGGKEFQVLEAAILLYPRARKILETEQEILELFGKERLRCERLRIGVSSIPGQYVLPAVLKKFSARYPEVQLDITQTDSRGVIEGVAAERFDLGLAGTGPVHGGELEFDPIYEDELVIIAPNEEPYRAVASRGLPLELLEKTPLILREEGSGTRTETEQYLKMLGIETEKLRTAAVMDNPENIKRAVEAGVGISFISRLAAEDYGRDGRILLFPLQGISMKRKLYAVTNKNVYRNEEMKGLLRLVRKAI